MLAVSAALCFSGCAAPAPPPPPPPNAPEDPSRAAVMAVLRASQFDVDESPAPWCERITSAAQWRELRQRLGGGVATLHDDWCDFEHDCIVVLVAEQAPESTGFEVSVLEEEGVDVVVASCAAPRAADPAARGRCLLLVVARRPAQLAVVLRTHRGGEPGQERTLQVFAGW